ncbi:MAG: uncharacterized protein A8A55_1626 [Amphiamblys sp. WSBS2006]|nr:MAG: uncharacterized protein A8A55_1626 [Amphiamblys sp. WSBS2006]
MKIWAVFLCVFVCETACREDTPSPTETHTEETTACVSEISTGRSRGKGGIRDVSPGEEGGIGFVKGKETVLRWKCKKRSLQKEVISVVLLELKDNVASIVEKLGRLECGLKRLVWTPDKKLDTDGIYFVFFGWEDSIRGDEKPGDVSESGTFSKAIHFIC